MSGRRDAQGRVGPHPGDEGQRGPGIPPAAGGGTSSGRPGPYGSCPPAGISRTDAGPRHKLNVRVRPQASSY